ncbi:ATP-dependent RNA helicase DEAH12-like protein [Cladobotryum mycophilum]|uniref:ATP-dependent RNA helicase DEAH12-like protein n=1 Tax=Cladobotryum mycophilum TaxID=491253 RepID=A0ABR0SMZ0_9HYPO
MGNIFGAPSPPPPPKPQPHYRPVYWQDTQPVYRGTHRPDPQPIYRPANRPANRDHQTVYRTTARPDPQPAPRPATRPAPQPVYRQDPQPLTPACIPNPIPARITVRMPEQRPREDVAPQRALPPCPYYARGACLLGGDCPFCREAALVVREPRANARPPRPCRFFAQGHCKKGAACNYSHDKNDATNTMTTDNNASNDNQTYEFGGAWAKFGNGATVSKIFLSSDFSAVRIRNLPLNSTVNSVKAILADVGIQVPAAEMRVMTHTDQGNCSATVKAEDPSFAKNVCNRLRTYTTLPGIEGVVIPVGMGQSQSLHQVDCRKVHCSWLRPTRVVQLSFATRTIALRVQKKFNTGNYKVLGNKVTASAPTGQGNQDQSGWKVTLRGLPDTIEEKNITQGIPEADKPRLVEIGAPSYVADLEFDSTVVKSMLLEFGQLERWEVSPNSKGKRVNAHATFFEEAHARDAASSLHNKALSFSEKTQLAVRVVTSAKFKVSTRVYEAVQKQIKSQKIVWERQFMRYFEYPTQGLYRNLKLEGDNHQQVAKAKESIEKIIGGEVVRVEGKDLRNANFRNGGDEFKKIKTIEDSLKVVIVPDVRTSQFRVFGLEANSGATLERIRTMIQDCLSDSHTIELSIDDFRWLSRGGFALLEARLGKGKAALNITARQKHVCIRGSKADYNKAMTIIASRQPGSAGALSHSETACSSCWCEAEEPIRMSCHHVYCSDCFVGMCVAEMTGQKEFHISCVKAVGSGQDTCQKAFSLVELQEHLPSETFEDILEASFASYVGRHPADFRYCPTPDCGQIYRVSSPDTDSPSTFTCKKCLTPTCTGCHSPHPGRTCADYRGRGAGRAEVLNNERKAELGIKDCPRCKIMLEKTAGCNHMTCKCGAHVCWVCLATFEVSGECYAHMRKVHGGIGI